MPRQNLESQGEHGRLAAETARQPQLSTVSPMALVAPDRSSERPDGVIGPESSPTAPVVEVSGLHVSFERGGRPVRAIRGVDLVIGRGEILGLVGESGSG